MHGHRLCTPASTASRLTPRLPSKLSAQNSGTIPASRSRFPRWLRVSSQLMSGIFAWNVLLAVPLQSHAQGAQASNSAPVKPYAGIKSSIKLSHIPNRLSLPADCLVPLPINASSAKQARPASLSLLNDIGGMARPVSSAQISTWRTELAAKKLSRRGIALRHLWIGEWQMAHDQNLIGAQSHFDTAVNLTNTKDKEHGLATYDTAVNQMLGGRYEKARVSFEALLKSRKPLTGFDAVNCSIWARHARACAGYHAERAKLGIIEPERLDPNCGAAALAMWLRENKLPYDMATVLKAVRPTGQGSKTREVEAGAQRLGLETKTVAADEAALPYLPKPLMAFVEHDHFVAVTGTDKEGVTYNCSDCGKWPGGYQHITWALWNKLEATEYTLFAKPFTPQSALIESIPTAEKFLNTQGNDENAMAHSRTWRRHHVCAIIPIGQCGFPNYSQQCDCERCCPTDSPCPGSNPYAASAGDPVNLATLQEEYKPTPDLTVYNPTGPSVSFQRQYCSLANPRDVGMGARWTHNYNYYVQISPPQGQNPLPTYFYEPNGAAVPVTVPRLATASEPSVLCSVGKGYPMQVYSKWSTQASANYFDIVFADRSRWTTSTGYTSRLNDGTKYALSQFTDGVGNSIQFVNSPPGSTGKWTLNRINDSSGSALLTLSYDVNGNLTSVADRYGRSVIYQYGSFPYFNGTTSGTNQTQLTHVSQIVPTGTATPPDRYAYGYGSVSNNDHGEYWPFLTAISVPSPTGSGTSTARIEYASGTMWVSALVDANGNRREYSNVAAGSATTVTVKQKNADSTFTTIYTYTAGYDANMSGTTITDGSNTTVINSRTYADPNDPYRPSQVQDGNGVAAGGANGKGTWTYTWDQYGHCTSRTTPRSTTKTNTFNYTNFALGELTSIQEGTKTPTTISYYEPSGLTHTVSTPKPGTVDTGQTVLTTYNYSARGNLTSVIAPGNATASTMTTAYGYTSDGTYSQTEALGQPLTVTDNLGKITHLRYDSQSRPTSTTDALGNTTTQTYTLAGQEWQTTLPATGQTGSGNGSIVNTYLYSNGPLTQMATFDESNVQQRRISPTYGYEGERLSETGDVNPVTTAYDGMYRTAKLTDGNSHATTYTHDTTGHMTQVQYPNGNTFQATSWDADGQPLTTTDARGMVRTYIYNDLESRLTDLHYPTGNTGFNVHVDYDSYGRPSNQTDNVGGKTIGYDNLDVPTSTTVTYTGLPAKTLAYNYNNDGSRSSLSTPAGLFNYGYDGRGLPNSLSNPAGENFAWTYLDTGWLWTQTSAGAAKTSYTYNQLGQLTDLANHQTNMAQTLLSDFGSLNHDAVGNRTSLTASLPAVPSYGGTTSYLYDTKEQLKQESSTRTGGYTNGFVYDPVGNPTTFKGATNTFNTANQNTQGGTVNFDGNGNPSKVNSQSLTWDVNNKLTAVGTALTAASGADGLRAWKQNSTSKTYFLYDGVIPVCELDNAGNVIATNTVGANGVLARRTGTTSVFYTFDPQGSVAQRLDSSGNVLSSHANEGFGVQVSTGTGYSNDPYAGYGGQWGYYRDSETGLHLLGHRFYDASNGRFLSRDPIGYGGGINLYAYTGNNVTGGIDPMGWDTCLSSVGDPVPNDLWHRLTTFVGQQWTQVNTEAGLLAGIGGHYHVDPRHGTIVVRGGWLQRFMGQTPALTLGDVVLFNPTESTPCSEKERGIYEHELEHVHQYRVLGPYFLPLYAVGAASGWARGDIHEANPFEFCADHAAGGKHKEGNPFAQGW